MPSTISKDENLLTYKGARLYYTIYPSKYEPDEEPYIFIHMIKVPEESRGLGYASILLKQVIDYADRNQLLIQLEVPWIEYDNTGLSVDELEAWYGRYGFIYDGNLFFNREPRKIRRENTMRKRFREAINAQRDLIKVVDYDTGEVYCYALIDSNNEYEYDHYKLSFIDFVERAAAEYDSDEALQDMTKKEFMEYVVEDLGGQLIFPIEALV